MQRKGSKGVLCCWQRKIKNPAQTSWSDCRIWGAVNSDEFPLQEDFQHWKRAAGFCFCHYPFVFEAASKAVLLDIENQGEQFASFREVMMQALQGDEMRESPYLVLRVPPMDTTGSLSPAQAKRAGIQDGSLHTSFGALHGVPARACSPLLQSEQLQQPCGCCVTLVKGEGGAR